LKRFKREDFGIFAGRRLLLFHEARGEDQKEKDRFTFLREPEMPDILRLFPKQEQATYYELHLWREIYGSITDTNPQHAADAGLTIRKLESKPVRLERGRTYIATLTRDQLTITPDSTFGMLRDMQEELARQKEEEKPTDK